jgi:hypothetical protein
MNETEIAIEETKTQPESRTARFAQWLMDRDAKREEKESNLEGLMKFNIFLSTITLVSVAGATALDYAFFQLLHWYLWLVRLHSTMQ